MSKQKTVKIRVDNPIMAYAALTLYGIECKRISNHVIVSEADIVFADTLLEEWKV